MLTVIAQKYRDARPDAVCESYSHRYKDKEGLVRVETCSYQSSSDFIQGASERVSKDNGKTWSEWKEVDTSKIAVKIGENEVNRMYPFTISGRWNPVHKHFVGTGLERIFVGGHEEAFRKQWKEGDHSAICDHGYIGVTLEDGTYFPQLITYEEGAERNADDLLNPEYRFKNNSFPTSFDIDPETGDILIAAGVAMAKCCEIRNVDVNEVFPHATPLLKGLMVIRGKWDGERYHFIPSPPVLINNLQSSRGVDEPTISVLKSGRILVVFRGSNWSSAAWKTRIEPGTPGFKWYTFSDDGGNTFSPAMPWHFDDGEVIYSSATISKFTRSEKNGRLYWIGNITGHNINGNFPRYPLCIVEVDETYGTVKKDSYTIIDTKREGESEKVQLSNFTIFQNRETGNIEVNLTKVGQYDGQSHWIAEPWHYEIVIPD